MKTCFGGLKTDKGGIGQYNKWVEISRSGFPLLCLRVPGFAHSSPDKPSFR